MFIATILVDFTIVPDFNVQLSPIKQYDSTTTFAPMTVAYPIVLPQPTTALGSTIQPGIKLADQRTPHNYLFLLDKFFNTTTSL